MVTPRAKIPCMQCGKEFETESYEEPIDGLPTLVYESAFCSKACEKKFKQTMQE